MAQTSGCLARPVSNSIVKNPLDLTAINGVLKVGFELRSQEIMELPLKVCYVYESSSGPVEAPTLRLAPGDQLELALTDHLTYLPHHTIPPAPSPPPHDPCAGGITALTSTNIDFDGLYIPPVCHEGEVTKTTIENTDPAFQYKFQIPKDHAPGMYWYHPLRLGSATLQLNGGASGVLIVGGMEKAKPQVTGLPERILVVRQQFESDDPDPWPPSEYELNLNFQPATHPQLPSPVIQMKPGKQEFWRVGNATSTAFLALQVVFGEAAQRVKLVALDGVPVLHGVSLRTIELPPGGRAEFLVTGPPAGQAARLLQTEVETGRTGFENPVQELAKIVATTDAQTPPALGAEPSGQAKTPPAANLGEGLLQARVTVLRKLYFAEAANGTNGPIRYLITVQGQTPRVFDPSAPPAVITKIGAVEDWILANHSGELHTFHLHGLHFLFLEVNGKRLPYPEMRDTVTIPAWEGSGPYPTVKVRMDFRDRRSTGTFVYHCQISHHAEAGMMGRIQVQR